MRTLMLSAASCALVVAGFLIFNAMSMAITQRRPMISMLRAIGANKRKIVRDLLVEAGLVGLVGGLVGSALGVIIGRQAIGALPAALLQGYESRTEYILPGYAIPVGIAACVVVSVAAAALAARQVYKVAPVEALAPVGASAADAVPRTARVAAGVVGIVSHRNGGLRRLRRPGKPLGRGDRAGCCSAISRVFRLRRSDRRGGSRGGTSARCARRPCGSDDRTCAAPCVGHA